MRRAHRANARSFRISVFGHEERFPPTTTKAGCGFETRRSPKRSLVERLRALMPLSETVPHCDLHLCKWVDFFEGEFESHLPRIRRLTTVLAKPRYRNINHIL